MKSFFIILSILLLGVPELSQASCLRSDLPTEYKPLIEDVWQSLPDKMKRSLCAQSISVTSKARLLSKSGVGLAVKPIRKIYLKAEILSNSLLSKEAFLTAKRNIIHELSHFYFWNQRPEKRELIILAGRTQNGFLFKKNRRRNHFSEASLDHYEFKNEEEFFAVNTELFLTMDDYKCRRPLQFHYLSRIYDHISFVDSKCKTTQLLPVTVNGEVRFKELDFKNLYQVNLLLADGGSDISSRFGHAMLRLVFCSKKRSSMSEACAQDIDSHVVLSFRANVTDERVNHIQGLFGGYESQMHILPYREVIDEYAGVEKRSLFNYPLNPDSYAKERLRDLVFDQAWTYRGKYKFLSSNCGTELLSFLQLLNPEKEIFQAHSFTPKLLVKNLKRLGVILDLNADTDVVLPRTSEPELQFSKLKLFLGDLELRDYLQLKPEEREELLTGIPPAREHGAILVQLQNKIIAEKQRHLWNTFVSSLEKNKEDHAHLRNLFPKFVVPKGIPDQGEVAAIRREMDAGLHPDLRSVIRTMFPEDFESLDREIIVLQSILKNFFPKEEK